MGFSFLSFLIKNNKRKERTNIAKQVDDIHFKIISDRIEISDSEADMIIKIICDELKNVTHHTGYVIAKRISEEVNKAKICAADVNGETDGKNWLIQISSYPLEFID